MGGYLRGRAILKQIINVVKNQLAQQALHPMSLASLSALSGSFFMRQRIAVQGFFLMRQHEIKTCR
jgi:hypothetical protein